jgi:hypothetical protein
MPYNDAYSLCIYVFMEDGLVNNTAADVIPTAGIQSSRWPLPKLKILCFISTSTLMFRERSEGFELARYREEQHRQSQHKDHFHIILLLQ